MRKKFRGHVGKVTRGQGEEQDATQSRPYPRQSRVPTDLRGVV